MKIVALIPFWDSYYYGENFIQDRDTSILAGKILLSYPIELANKNKLVSNTYVFSNNLEIAKQLDPRLSFELLSRSKRLDSQDASIEEIIGDFFSRIRADVVVLMHPNAPFVTQKTLSDCIYQVQGGGHDSAFMARIEQKFGWLNGSRVNYSISSGTPHLSNVSPLVLETSSLYVFTKSCFNEFGTRIGGAPFIKSVGYFEGMVINTHEDMRLAEFLLDSQFQIGI